MDIQTKKDHTRLKNLLTNYRNDIITRVSDKQTWKNIPQIINQVDEAIYIIQEGL